MYASLLAIYARGPLTPEAAATFAAEAARYTLDGDLPPADAERLGARMADDGHVEPAHLLWMAATECRQRTLERVLPGGVRP